MKRTLLCLSALLCFSTTAFADTEVVDGIEWTYTISNGEAFVYDEWGDSAIRNDSIMGAVVVPDTLGGCPVTGIGDNAFSYCTKLTSITIPGRVTRIGDNAFFNCSGLSSITIPNGVTRIGDCAFSYCWGLSSITIPNSVTNIGFMAFRDCSELTSITIPDGVKSIESSTFENCSGLDSITIPNSVMNIGDSAFRGCSGLTSITIPNSVTNIGDYAFCACSGLTSITIPDSVTNMATSAFDGCRNVKGVTIPAQFKFVDIFPLSYASITNVVLVGNENGIPDDSFSGCQELESVTIQDGVTSIGSYAFNGCSRLTSITIPASVTSLGDFAFGGCSGLTSITIPNGVTYISSFAFQECSGLQSIEIPDGVLSIGYCAFAWCSGLTSVVLPDSVEVIGQYAFTGCSSLTSITVPSHLTGIGRDAFDSCPHELFDTTTIPGVRLFGKWVVGYESSLSADLDLHGIQGIAAGAFAGCSKLHSISIPEGVTQIGYSCFSSCSALASVSMPTSLTIIESYAFAGCSALESVLIPTGVTRIEDNAFYNCSSLSEIHISDLAAWCGISFNGHVDNPCYYAHHLFLNGEEITNLVIPDGLTSIGMCSFVGCSGLTSITIPAGVSCIGYSAFSGCSGLTSVSIPESVTSVEDGAFEGCFAIKDVVVPGRFRLSAVFPSSYRSITNAVVAQGSSSIENQVFYGCSGLRSITIPDGVTSIGNNAFSYCSGLMAVVIPDSVTNVGSWAFEGCSGLESITIGAGISSLDGIPTAVGEFRVSEASETFSAADGVLFGKDGKTLLRFPKKKAGAYAVPDDATSIADGAFSDCSGLTSVWIPGSVTNIGSGSFSGCSGLSTVYLHVSYSGTTDWIPFGVTIVRWGAFGNGSWETAVVGDSIVLGAPLTAPSGRVEIPAEIGGWPVVAIGADAFAGNTAITGLSIPASVTNVAENAFAGCTGLREVSVGTLFSDRLADMFPDSAASVERVSFLEGVTAIPDSFFEGCTALRTMDLAKSVVDIGTDVFEACSALETVATNGVELYQGWALGMSGGAAAPADLVVPDGVRGIAANAFEGEWRIGTLTMPESLRFVGARAFKDCTALESIAVPEGVAKIDREAFRNCTYAQSLALPGTLRELGSGAFENCSMLLGAALPAGVAAVGENAFSNCWRMLSVSIPQSVERVGNGAFADCRKLAGVAVPLHVAPLADLFPAAYGRIETVAVAAMPDGADAAFVASRQMVPGMFAGCAALEGIELPAWVCNVADGAFEGCASISSLAFPDAVTNIGARACASMAALESVAFPAALVSVGGEAFDGDAGLASLALPDGLRSIGARAFRGLTLLPRADLPGSVRSIGTDAFAGCGAIRAVTVPGDVETLASVFPAAYQDIVSATVVAETDADGAPVPQRVPTLRERLFDGCSSLTKVELPQNLAEIGSSAFGNCAALAELGIPSSVTNVGAAAFAGCGTLSSVALPKDLEVLQDGTFQGCESMAEIVVPESVRRLGNGIFDGCTLLRSVKYVGNAPAFSAAGGGPYAGLPAGAKSYVENGSKGWDGVATSMSLPEFWPDGTTYEIAFWEPNRFDAAFDPNHDAEEPLQVGQVTGTSYVLPAAPVRLGARFDGWWTERENGARITASTQVLATRPHALYAHWTMNRYHVHFDANGGTGTADPVEMTVGTPAALPACPFGKIGNSFAGWATEPGGAAVYADGADVVDLAYANNAAVTLYAVWRERPWTVSDYLDATELSFETAGGGAWAPDWADFKAGGVSLRCEGLPPAASGGRTNATLRTTVVGAGTLAFWWKTDCEEKDEVYDEWFDYATFAVDGAEVARIAGDSGWLRVECAVSGAGEHELAWTFTRDDYDEDGADWENALWVDGVEWTPAAVTVSFDAGGAAEGEAPAPVVKWAGYALVLPGPGTLADPPRAFAGWSDGENVRLPGETFVFGSEDVVLTAVWTLKTWTLAEAVDAPALVFATGGTTNWTVDAASGWTNGVSAKSGAVANGESSWIETTVSGAGTLVFRWKVLGGIYRNNPFAYAKVETNGATAAQTHLTDGWEERTITVTGAGAHTVRWTYLRTSARDCEGDCAWLDGVAWTPAGGTVVVEGVAIPTSWIEANASAALAAAGGDCEAAATATAANGRPVWECYVADLDPEDPDDDLVVTIEMVGGQANVSILKGEKATRTYDVQGAPTPAGPWGERNSDSRFFRIRTTIPE